MVHLICGLPGSGKTTYANEVARNKRAVYFSIDNCLKPLSYPQSFDLSFLFQLKQRADQCEITILHASEKALAERKEVVLDIASFKRIDRDRIRAWANTVKSPIALCYLKADKLIRWERVQKRNRLKGETHSFDVPRWVFDFAENWFEPLSEDENAIVINTDS